MGNFFNLPIFGAIAIVSIAHALVCFAVAGADGLRQTALLSASLVVSSLLSKASTPRSHWAWLRSYPGQFRIWVFFSAVMALIPIYYSARRFDVLIAEALATAAFFMAMVSIGNRVLK